MAMGKSTTVCKARLVAYLDRLDAEYRKKGNDPLAGGLVPPRCIGAREVIQRILAYVERSR